MPQIRHFEDPMWEEVLNGQATVDDYIHTVSDSIWDSFGTIPKGKEANELIRKQYIIDKQLMTSTGMKAEDIPDPLFR